MEVAAVTPTTETPKALALFMAQNAALCGQLTQREMRFCAMYVQLQRAGKAAQTAGYEHPFQASQELLQRAEIVRVIQELNRLVQAHLEAGTARIIDEYHALAFGDIQDFLDVLETGDVGLLAGKDTRSIKRVEVTTTTPEGGASQTKVKLELYDKKAALDRIAQYKGMLKEEGASLPMMIVNFLSIPGLPPPKDVTPPLPVPAKSRRIADAVPVPVAAEETP